MEVREGECALCGVVLPFDDECIILFVGSEACLAYHQWCWDTTKDRIVRLRPEVQVRVTVQDLIDLGLYKWSEEGEETSKDDADSDAPGDAAADSSDTEGNAPSV